MTRYMRGRPEAIKGVSPREGFVVLSNEADPERSEPFEVALCTIRIARRLGVIATVKRGGALLPYASDHDNLVFDAPIASWIANARIRYLRGWKQYSSCVKGFNGLGLISDLVVRDIKRIARLSSGARIEEVARFLATRKSAGGPTPMLTDPQARQLAAEHAGSISDLDLAIWRVCANRTIVCSTSSNMGISLHEILRYMQQATVSIGERSVPLLNQDEGRLIIWCPDEEADFMSPEKTAALRAIEAEQPALTTLHTYINRKQRDPGALADALNLGGYFFPTNPQSREELQNLLANALKAMAADRGGKEADLLAIDSVRQLLETLGCVFRDGKLQVREGVESGLYGLMGAYLLMLDETLQDHELLAISTWNQASIGAALAAAVLADEGLRDWERLSPMVRSEITEQLPDLAGWLKRRRLGVDVKTRIHGVFDLANLQSLAQLLGVVVERHSSGRGTAYVGLGSSSYSNGNRCFEILRNSEERGGPFHGKTTFHPATHTLNPIAQAIVVADDLLRAVRASAVGPSAADVAMHVRKPEPAGAAALAGYLLTRLDGGTLSVEEIAYALRLSGFTRTLFLELAGYAPDDEGASWFVQEASEEGEPMEMLAESFLSCLDMELGALAAAAAAERGRSEAEYRTTPIDPPDYEALDPVVNIYLTGDNTAQPSEEWFGRIVTGVAGNLASLDIALGNRSEVPAPPGGGRAPTPSSHAAPARFPSSMDLLGHVEQVFRANRERVFLIDASSRRTWTYGQLFEVARAIAGGLQQAGIRRGDRVAVLLPNGVPLAATYFACLMTGIVAVPVNPVLSLKEIATILRLSRAKLVLFSSETHGRMAEAGANSSMVHMQVIGLGVSVDPPEEIASAARVLDLDHPVQEQWGAPFFDCRQEDPFLILFTSGTTALPKGVVHSAANELGNAVTFNAVMGIDRDSRFLHVWPMAYSSGILNTMLSPFMAEGSVVLAGTFDARSALGFWGSVIEHNVNTLWLSPTMLASLLAVDRDVRAPSYCKEHLRLVCCGTAALPLAVKRKFEQKYGVEVFESYGLTELLIVAGNSPRYARRDGSVGTALAGVDIRIGRPEGIEGEDDIGGEVLVNAPCAMIGYVDPESGDVSPLAAGTYFPTGDLGRLDADGNLFITGRKKDLIVRGGQTISPAAVREVLLNCAEVEDAYVVGMPHHFYGEEVAAVVILKGETSFETAKGKILEKCRQELNPGAVPSVIAELDKFPVGGTGKVLAREIRSFLSSVSGGGATGR